MTEGQLPEHRRGAELRASHDDREQVAEQLREAAGDGRIDLGELEERLERALTAKTYDELVPLTADLAGPAGGRAAEPLVLAANAGVIRQDGYWVVPPLIRATTDGGAIAIDFTGAVCRGREVELEIDVRKGRLDVVVPRGWTVSSHGVQVDLGVLRNQATEPPAPGSPALRVTGRVEAGSTRIRYPAAARRRWWNRRARRA
jgi:hypothetical protein